MPLICTAWEAISTPPSSLWHSVVVDLRSERRQPDDMYAHAKEFFRARANHVKNLAFILPIKFYEDSGFVPIVLGSALGAHAALKCLCIDFDGAAANYMRAVLSAARKCGKLEVLHLRDIDTSERVRHQSNSPV